MSAALLVGLAAATWPAVAPADDWRRGQSTAAVVDSASTKRAGQLKWLPYRPSRPRGQRRAAAKRLPTGSESRAPAWTARRSRSSVFDDPFGDAGLSSQPSAPASPSGRKGPQGSERPAAEATLADLQPRGLQGPTGAPGEPQIERLPGPTMGQPLGQQEVGEPTDAWSEIDLSPAPLPLADDALAGDGLEQTGRCPSPDDPDYHTPISELSHDTSAEAGEFPRECPLTEKTIRPFARGRLRESLPGEAWAPSTFTWKASGLCHKPLYFEDVHPERYGHSWGPFLQPVASGARFFLTVPALPYLMGLNSPCECVYALGYYRPGSCAPYMLDPLPVSIRAALAEGGAWTGLAFLIP